MTASYSGIAINKDLGRLINVSSNWTIVPNVFINGSYQTTINLTSVGLPYHGYGNITQVNVPLAQYYNRSWVYRGGLDASAASPNTTTPNTVIGFWLNGVAIFNPSAGDAAPLGYSKPTNYHFNSSYAEENTLGYTFHEDLAGGVADTTGKYHYNSYSFVNAWNTGLGGTPYSSTVHGLPEIDVIPYLSGGLTHPDGHSKIVGFALDGYPIYGPYGYATATNNSSGVKSVTSGYTLKNSSYRHSTAAENTAIYPMGIFVEDYEYTGVGDLDTHNGRYCVTPDFPLGTYAYFCTLGVDNNPCYPYVIGNTYFGDVDILTLEQSVGVASGYPEWVTPSGNLGKIQALQFFELGLQAVDPTGNPDGSDVNYKLVAGRLPAGMQIDNSGKVTGNPKDTYSIDGVPEAVTQDRTSNFTIRAISSSGKITDRSFTITVTGNYPPQLLTSNYLPLGEFLDGTQISYQLSAVDLNADSLTYSLIAGELPPGVTLSSSGLISGIIIPQNKTTPTASYNFTISLTDGKSFDIKQYSILVHNHSDIRADNTTVTDDSSIITADTTNVRTPILLTTSLGDYSTVVSGNYFAFKFDGIDYDGIPVNYSLSATSGTGWDSDTVFWDNSPWDQSDLTLPPGLTLDSITGWMTGFIPAQSLVTHPYSFGVQVYNSLDSSVTSPLKIFTITILGSLNLNVTFTTPSDLGYIDAGSVSTLSINAVAASGRQLYYSLAEGSRLPQGLKLLNDGSLSGRTSFQAFSLDKGLTTFDVKNVGLGIYTLPTTIDKTYTFTVLAQDYSTNVSGSKTFKLQINTVTYGPYDNLYIACRPNANKRELLNTILGNTDYFALDDIYRPNDPWWGIQKDIKILVGYGLTPSQSSSYIAAMKKRHYNKKFYFGDYHYASAKDKDGNALYDVIYVDLLEDTKTYTTQNGVTTKNIPTTDFVTFFNGNYKLDTVIDLQTTFFDNRYTIFEENLDHITLYPNDLDLMINDIIVAVGEANSNTLPQWQTSIQSNGKIIGFQTAAVLAYLKPGTGEKVLYKLKHSIPTDIKTIPFISDRYILDNNLDKNFDITTQKWAAKKYTTFDTGYVLTITPSAIVDYAVDIPFNSIDGNTISQIQALGGLDGDKSGDWNGKQIIFSTQELYDPTLFPSLTNNGWIQNNTAIPGYAEVQQGTASVNKRGGVWSISIANNLVTLTFVKQILVNQVVSVRFGAKSSKTLDYSAATVGVAGQTVPKYVSVNVNTIQLKSPTTFDKKATVFINNEDQYSVPFTNDSYLKFPRENILE